MCSSDFLPVFADELLPIHYNVATRKTNGFTSYVHEDFSMTFSFTAKMLISCQRAIIGTGNNTVLKTY